MRKTIGSLFLFVTLFGQALDARQGAFDTREAFDAMLEGVPAANLERDNEAGGIAWGTSYYMDALVAMYQATGDTAYLDRLIEAADRVLAMRDSETGVTDYRGESHPGWTAGAHYSIGEIELKNTLGRPALYLRTAFWGYNNQTEVTVTASGTAGRFDIRIRNERYDREEVFENLSMDPESDRYAPAVIGESEMAQPYDLARLAVRRLENGAEPLAPVRVNLEPSRYLWPVHQGMIVHPMLAFARLVREQPELRDNPRFVSRADEYTKAAVAIMEVLERDWQENHRGEGWYGIPRGAPIWFDGIEPPLNHTFAVGRAMVHLAAVTGEARWIDRAKKMAITFRRSFRVQENGSLIWHYWWHRGLAYNGWGPDDDVSDHAPALRPVQVAEDYSHGSIGMHFAWLCYHDAYITNLEDMQRMAKTFLLNLVAEDEEGRLTLHERIDGTGRLGRHDQRGPYWVLLAEFDPQVFEIFRDLREDQGWSGQVVQLLASANLNLVRAWKSSQQEAENRNE